MPRSKLPKACHRIASLLALPCLLLPALVAQNPTSHIVHRPPATSAPANSPSSNFDATGEAQLVDLINQARAAEGLALLTVDTRLTEAARKHTELMVQHSALSHQFDGEAAMQQRFADAGLPSDREGENVDLDQNVPAAHQALMDSPPHRHNLLGPDYNVVGVGILRSGENIYVTEDFARRLSEYSEPQAEAALQSAIEHYVRSVGLPVPARKPEPQLRHMACDMALNDALNNQAAAQLPGAHEVMVWTAGDPGKLSDQVKKRLSQAVPPGYALGACFAPSVSHPGGLYWVIMVTY